MEEDSKSLLEVRDLTTHFFTQKGEVSAIDNVSISVGKGKIVGIVGESGSGKSVTSLSIMQLVSAPGKIIGGEIIFEGKDLLKNNNKEMAVIRGNDISMIFQEPMTSLNPVYTVGRQVEEALLTHHKDIDKKEAKKKVIDIFNLVGIGDAEKRYNVYPHQLSGGLRQRIMIAMALICKTKLLIADEPTTALDVTIEAQILKLLKNLRDEIGTSIIIITHNLGVVAEICDYVYVMYAGKVVEQADVFELFDNPKHPYTKGLLKSMPGRNKDNNERNRLYSIEGMVPNMLYPPSGCRFNPRCSEAMDICRKEQPPLVETDSKSCVSCWKYQKQRG